MSLKVNIKDLFDNSIYFFVFCTFLIPWFKVMKIGNAFELRFFHFAILLLLAGKLFSVKIRIIPTSIVITTFMFLSFLLFFISIFWGDDPVYGITLFIKNVIYFLFFILISDFFLRDIKNFRKRLIKYAKLSIYVFIFYNILITIATRENIFFNTLFGVFGADSNKVNYYYFFKAVNFRISTFDFITWGEKGFHVPSFRNVFGVSLIIIYSIIDMIENPKVSEKLILLFIVLLILMSQSRSTMLIFVIIFIIKYLVNKNNRKLFIIIFISPFILLIALLIFDFGVFERFTEFSKDIRIFMFLNTFGEISSNFLFGKGFGSLVEYGGKEYHVHNFIIAAWHSSGFFGLIFSIIVILELILKFKKNIKFNKSNFKYYFIYGFPLLVLIRMMVGGNNGLPSFHDWFALSIFYISLYIFNFEKKINSN